MKSTIKTQELATTLCSVARRHNDLIATIKDSPARSSIYSSDDVIRMVQYLHDETLSHINNVIFTEMNEYIDDVPVVETQQDNMVYREEDVIRRAVEYTLSKLAGQSSEIMSNVVESSDIAEHCTLDYNEYGGELTVSVEVDNYSIERNMASQLESELESMNVSVITAGVISAIENESLSTSSTTESQDNQ